jgi:HD-GYP domain-containing protein (c-di-GMP phosphodiesterase class II)
MTGNRPYRRALPWEVAEAEILRQQGGQFDPGVVHAFQDAELRLKAVYAELRAA